MRGQPLWGSAARVWVRAGLFAAIGLFFVGCVGGVTGKVDEETVPTMLSGFFVQNDEADGVFGVAGSLVSTLRGCEVATARQENLNTLTEDRLDALKDANNQGDVDDANEAFAQKMVEFDVANTPSDYWTVSVTVSAEDEDEIDGEDFDVEDGEAAVSVCRVNDHPAKKKRQLVRDEDCFAAVDGKVSVVSFQESASFKFTADVELADAQNVDNDAGDVTLTGEVKYCELFEKAVDDYAEILADAAAP